MEQPPAREKTKTRTKATASQVIPLLETLSWSIDTGQPLSAATVPEDARRLGAITVSSLEGPKDDPTGVRYNGHIGVIAKASDVGHTGPVVYGPYALANDGSLAHLEYVSRASAVPSLDAPTPDFVAMLTRTVNTVTPPGRRVPLVPVEPRIGLAGTGRFFRAAPATRAQALGGLTVGNSTELSARIAAAPTDTVLLQILAGSPVFVRPGSDTFDVNRLNARFWDVAGSASHRWVFAYRRTSKTLTLLAVEPHAPGVRTPARPPMRYILDTPLVAASRSSRVDMESILGIRGFHIYTSTPTLFPTGPAGTNDWTTLIHSAADRIRLSGLEDDVPQVARAPLPSKMVSSLPTTELARTLPELEAARRRIDELNEAIERDKALSESALERVQQIAADRDTLQLNVDFLAGRLQEVQQKYAEAVVGYENLTGERLDTRKNLENRLDESIAALEEYEERMQALRAELQEAQAARQDAMAARSRAQRQRDAFQAEVKALQDKTAEITRTHTTEITRLEEQLGTRGADADRLTAALQQAEIKYAEDLQKQAAANAVKLQEQEAQHVLALAEISANERAAYAKLAEGLDEAGAARERALLAELAAARQDITDARERTAELTKQTADVQSALASAEADAREQLAAQQALATERDGAQAQLKAAEAALEAATARITQIESTTQGDIAAMRARAEQAEQTIRELNAQIAETQAEAVALRVQVARNEADATTRLNAVNDAAALLIRSKAKTEAELRTAQRELQAALGRTTSPAELAAATQEATKLKGELADARAEVVRLEQLATEAAQIAQAETEVLRNELEDNRELIAAQQTQMGFILLANQTIDETIARNEELTAELAEVTAKHAQATRDADDAEDRLQALEMRVEVERTQAEEDARRCKEQIQVLQTQLDEAVARADAARLRYEAAIAEIVDVRDALLDQAQEADEDQRDAARFYTTYLDRLAEISQRHLAGLEGMEVLTSGIGSAKSFIRQLDTRAMRSDEVPALFAALGASATPNPRSVRFTTSASYRSRPPTEEPYPAEERLSGTDEYAMLGLFEFARFIAYLPGDRTGAALQVLETAEVALGYFYTQVIQPSAANPARALLSICAKKHEDLPVFLVDVDSSIIDAPRETQPGPANRAIEVAWEEAVGRSRDANPASSGRKMPLLAIWRSMHTGRTEPAGYIKLYHREPNTTGGRISPASRTPADVGIVPDRGYLYIPAFPLTGSARAFVYNLGGKRGMGPVTRRLSIDVDGGEESGLHLEVHVKRYEEEWHLVAMFVTLSYNAV